jgi:predicted nicotinamide N-methyase
MTPPDCVWPTRIVDYPVEMLDFDLGGRRIRLCAVRDLEGLVDRQALLRGDVDPPYWAYLWSGARVLATYLTRWIDVRGRRVLEIGCGLGLPGVTAAVLGGEVTLVDAEPVALAFGAASAAANGVACFPVVADFTRLDPAWRFDVILAAEVAYDRGRFAELAAVFARHLTADGVALIADGYRTDTRGLYRALADLRIHSHAIDLRIVEEGRPIPVRLTLIQQPAEPVRAGGTRRPPA